MEKVCRFGLSALALPAVVVFPDPKQAAAHARVPTTSPPTSRRESAAAAAAKTPTTSRSSYTSTSTASSNSNSGSSAASQTAERKGKQSSSSSVSTAGAATTVCKAADVDCGDNGGAATFILQLAVVLLEDEVDLVEIDGRAGEALGSQTTPAAAAASSRRVRAGKADGVVARDGGEEASSLPLPAAVVDRAGESGRVLRVTLLHCVGHQQGAAVDRDDGGQHGQAIFFLQRIFSSSPFCFHVLCFNVSWCVGVFFFLPTPYLGVLRLVNVNIFYIYIYTFVMSGWLNG